MDTFRAGIYGGAVSYPEPDDRPNLDKGSRPAAGQQQPGQQAYGTGYGGVQYPYPEGQAPAGQSYPGQQGQQGYPYNPYGQTPYGQTPYGRSPYGGYPAGLDDRAATPARRPAILVLALVLQILAALPFLVFGAIVLAVPLDSAAIPPEVLDNPDLAAAGVTVETLLSLVRVFGGIFVGLSLIYIVFAVVAFTGRNWARVLVTVMTVGFSLFLLFAAFTGGAADPASAAILLLPVVLAVLGVVLLFLPASNAWFSAPRR